jgi:hypothetical protein
VKRYADIVSGLLALTIGAIAVGMPPTGFAQSDTGRSRPASVRGDEPDVPSWWIAAGVGVATSGDLFKVEVAGGPATWLPPAGGSFNSDRFIVTLDEDLAVAATVGYRLGSRWNLRGDVSWSRLNATAEARVGQSVLLYPYDRLSTLQLGLEAEVRLIRTPSYPYLLAGLVVVDIDAQYASELDQTVWGPRLGIGYQHAFDPVWSLRVEIRDTIVSIDTENHRTEPAAGFEPDLTYERVDRQHLFELLALICVKL